MVQLRATTLGFLVTTCVISLTLAVPTMEEHLDDNQLSTAIACAADYDKMSIDNRKVFQDMQPSTHSICIRANGDFVATVWSSTEVTFTYMFDTCGWMKSKINLPSGISRSAGCAFSTTNFFYSDITNKKILRFDINGTYQNEFVTGQRYLRQAVQGNLLYSTIDVSKKIIAYHLSNASVAHKFETTTGLARGMAFDSTGHLYVSTWGNVVEIFTAQGSKVEEKTFTEIGIGDGILVDSNHFIILADRQHKNVYVFNHKDALTKTITGFADPADIAMGHQCGYLIVADSSRGGFYLL